MYKFIFTMLFASLLVACSDSNQVRAGKYGMMSKDTPQYAAILFMQAVYEEQKLDKALELSSERFAQRIRSLHTPKTVQRQIFNLRLDSMTAEPVSGGTLLYSERQKDANIEVKIIGHYNGDKIIDLKTLVMKKEKGDWKVAAVKNSVP